MIKKLTIAVIIYIACQFIAILLLSDVDFNSTTEEVDMEIYEFEHEGHGFLIFKEEGRTISVIHDPNCEACANNQN